MDPLESVQSPTLSSGHRSMSNRPAGSRPLRRNRKVLRARGYARRALPLVLAPETCPGSFGTETAVGAVGAMVQVVPRAILAPTPLALQSFGT